MVKVSQDSPPYLPGKFFSGEQQGEGHGVVQCVEGEYHQWCFFLSFKSIIFIYFKQIFSLHLYKSNLGAVLEHS